MSTYYYLVCNKCRKKIFSFSRQVWGLGNYDDKESIAFMMKHAVAEECGEENITLISEHDERNYDYEHEAFTDKDKSRFTPLKDLNNEDEKIKTTS